MAKTAGQMILDFYFFLSESILKDITEQIIMTLPFSLLYKLLISVLLVFFLSGCATSEPIPSQDFNKIRENISRFQSETIRLGGKITGVTVSEQIVKMEILSIPLELGQPNLIAKPDGRFVAITNRHRLPTDFNPLLLNGQFITAIGKVQDRVEVDNQIGYFSTFSIQLAKLNVFDFHALALSQGLIKEKRNSLEELKAMFEVKILEIQYLKQLIAEVK